MYNCITPTKTDCFANEEGFCVALLKNYLVVSISKIASCEKCNFYKTKAENDKARLESILKRKGEGLLLTTEEQKILKGQKNELRRI